MYLHRREPVQGLTCVQKCDGNRSQTTTDAGPEHVNEPAYQTVRIGNIARPGPPDPLSPWAQVFAAVSGGMGLLGSKASALLFLRSSFPESPMDGKEIPLGCERPVAQLPIDQVGQQASWLLTS